MSGSDPPAGCGPAGAAAVAVAAAEVVAGVDGRHCATKLARLGGCKAPTRETNRVELQGQCRIGIASRRTWQRHVPRWAAGSPCRTSLREERGQTMLTKPSGPSSTSAGVRKTTYGVRETMYGVRWCVSEWHRSERARRSWCSARCSLAAQNKTRQRERRFFQRKLPKDSTALSLVDAMFFSSSTARTAAAAARRRHCCVVLLVVVRLVQICAPNAPPVVPREQCPASSAPRANEKVRCPPVATAATTPHATATSTRRRLLRAVTASSASCCFCCGCGGGDCKEDSAHGHDSRRTATQSNGRSLLRRRGASCFGPARGASSPRRSVPSSPVVLAGRQWLLPRLPSGAGGGSGARWVVIATTTAGRLSRLALLPRLRRPTSAMASWLASLTGGGSSNARAAVPPPWPSPLPRSPSNERLDLEQFKERTGMRPPAWADAYGRRTYPLTRGRGPGE